MRRSLRSRVVSLADLTIKGFLEALGAKTPAPGGGAAAALTGAIAAAQAQMVVAYSVGKKGLEEHRETLEQGAARLAKIRDKFLALADEDAKAYTRLREALALAKDDPARADAVGGAAREAMAAPVAALELADELAAMCEALAPITNRNLRSDLGVTACLAAATACASQWNVWVNAPLLDEASPGEGAMALSRANRVVADCRDRAHRVESLCAARS